MRKERDCDDVQQLLSKSGYVHVCRFHLCLFLYQIYNNVSLIVCAVRGCTFVSISCPTTTSTPTTTCQGYVCSSTFVHSSCPTTPSTATTTCHWFVCGCTLVSIFFCPTTIPHLQLLVIDSCVGVRVCLFLYLR